MKSFAAAASMAAIASAAQVVNMGDKSTTFADAFISNFTGQTDNSTVDACFKNNEIIEQTLAATSLIKVNDYMRGYHRIYKLWNENPQAKRECTDHRYFWSDSSVMGQWGNMVQQPTVVAETLVNNWSMNKDAIIDAINRLEDSLAADDFTTAGSDLAEVLQYGLGDVSSSSNRATEFLNLQETDEPDDKALVLLVKNFISQVIYMNHFDSLKSCSVDATSVVSDIRQIYNAFKDGHEMVAFGLVTKLANKVRKLTKSQCNGAPEELAALLTWMLEKMTSKDKMVEAASTNAHSHSQEIYIHVTQLWDNLYTSEGFKPTNFDKMGIAIGNVAYWALGPATPTYGFPDTLEL